jgi:photosystem I subunit X
MINSTLLFAAAIPIPMSQAWSPTVGIVMVVANLLGILAATKAKKAGPMLGGLTLAQVIGGASFGHLLGAGAILGLTSIGTI